MPYVEEKIEVKGNIEEIFQLVSDVEKFPDFMEDVESVDILEEGDDWKISKWNTKADRRKIIWTEKDFIKPQENRVDFELVEGDLKSYWGFWQLGKTDNAELINITFAIDFEFGMPIIAPLIHPILARVLRANMKQMLLAIKNQFESSAL